MTEQKKDNYDELIAVNRELQQISENLEDTTRTQATLEDVADISHQIHREQQATLEELDYYWKGSGANRFLSEAYEQNEQELRRSMRVVEGRQSEVMQERARLTKQEESLLTKRNKLKRDI